MSRGRGHIQQSILALLETDCDGAWKLGQICKHVYSGINRVEKKHRVATARAIRKMALPGTWRVMMIEAPGGEYCICNECSLLSMARRDFFAHLGCRYIKPEDLDFTKFMADYRHRYEPGNEYNTFGRVERAKRYRDGSEVDRIEMQINTAQQRARLLTMGGTAAGAAAVKVELEHIASLTRRRDAARAEMAV